MPLPKIDLPLHVATLPSDGQTKIQYRPFTVKEEKLLLMASASKDPAEIATTTKQVVNNCILSISNPKMKADDLTLLDFDYLFLHMRAKSIGDSVEQEYRCEHIIKVPSETANLEPFGVTVYDEVKCGMINKVTISVDDIVVTGERPNPLIKLTPTTGVYMKYPTFKMYDVNDEYSVLIECMDYIYDAEQKYKIKEQTREEIVAFIEGLTAVQFGMIQAYYDAIPKLRLNKKTFTCAKCQYEHTLNDLENPLSFFTYS